MDAQSYIHASRYARWLEDKERRETWDETVDRWWLYMTGKFPALSKRQDVKDAIYRMDVVPSMRTIMTAGEALEEIMWLRITVVILLLMTLKLLTRPYLY